MADDGVVIVLDFTQHAELAESRDMLQHSFRSTTSSRRPGARIEGTVVSFTRRVVTCERCGSKRIDFDGPHALLNTNEVGVQRDCVGRLFRNGTLVK